MSKMIHDLKGLKSASALIVIIYYALLLSSIIFADVERPRNMFYYNEMVFLPLIVMITAVYFQHELGGRMMEIFAVYPISFSGHIMRKLGITLFTAWILHVGWVLTYKVKFATFKSTLYSYFGQAPVFTEVSWIQLWLQALPAYLLMIGVTMVFMILSKRVYGGFIAGFALWMLEVLSNGQLIPWVTLLTVNLSQEVIFAINRFVLIGVFTCCIIVSMLLMNRRERWAIHQEIE